MDSFWLDILQWVVPSGVLGSVVTWFVSRRKRNNDFLADLQRSIDLLTEKYTKVLDENVTLRSNNARLLANQRIMEDKIDRQNQQIEQLTRLVEQMDRKIPNDGKISTSFPTAARRRSSGDDGRGGTTTGIAEVAAEGVVGVDRERRRGKKRSPRRSAAAPGTDSEASDPEAVDASEGVTDDSDEPP